MEPRSRDRRQRRGLLGAESKSPTQEVPCSSVREYLSAEQLAERTPWSSSAIEKMVSRGTLVRDVHYFQPFGHRTQLLFKWSTVVQLIEGATSTPSAHPAHCVLGKGRKGRLDVAQAEKSLGRLLGQ